MEIVCHQCGDVGYSDLLVYCCLCQKAARHQYCLDIIPELDEDLEWSCEDCKFSTNKVECVNGQQLVTSEFDVNLSNKENIIININDRYDNDVFTHEHDIKEWGYTKRRSPTSHEHGIKAWGNTKRKSPTSHEHGIKAWGNTKRRSKNAHGLGIKTWGCTRKRSLRSIKHTSEAYHSHMLGDGRKIIVLHEGGELIDEFQHLKNGKRKLILPNEEETKDEFPRPNGCRGKLISAHEDGDDGLSDDSMKESRINILRKRIILDPSFDEGGMHKLENLDKENEDDNVVVKSLKEVEVFFRENSKINNFEVRSPLPSANGDMSTKAASKDDLVKSSSDLPLIVDLHDSLSSRIYFGCTLAMPISWRGWFKISGRAYGPLIARLSPKVGVKAWNATKFLPQVIQLTMVSRSHAWPKSFKMSPPTDDHIALAFFPPDSRVEKMVDQLVQEVIRCDLMMKVALDAAKLLIFPSNLLPETYMRYQGKYYFWVVFKSKDSEKNAGETRILHAENSGKQTVPSSSIKSAAVHLERDDEETTLEGDKPKEKLGSVVDKGEDIVMGNDKQMKKIK